jgi:hypothetical protein
MPYVPTTKERVEEAMPYILPVICGLIVAGLIGWVAWFQFGPKKKEKAKTPVTATSDEEAKTRLKQSLAADVANLEKSYQEARGSGAAPAALESLLTRAIARQRERLNLEPAGVGPEADRLARLEALRGDLRARAAIVESQRLEKAADEERARGASARALQKLREALRLQQEANASAKDQDLIDLAREVRLAKIVGDVATGPLRDTVASARARAEAALKAQDWSGALKAYEEARAAQADLNTKTPEQRASNLATLEQLDTEIASLQAADLADKVSSAEKSALAAQAAGKATDAAAAFLLAARSQEELNAQFPKSRFASTEKIAEFAIQRETVLSTQPLERVAALDRESAALLHQRQTRDASAKVAEAITVIARVATEYPRSRALDSALRRKFEYLALRRDDLDSIQEQVYAGVARVPGAPGVSMLRTEVPQDLYTRIMNINPSRNQGRGLPVDSVSWNDAREFCERLGWMLGTSVRLPREAEFRSAWSPAAPDRVWSADNSAGRSRESGRMPASSAGFHDLAGNLAEWLEPSNLDINKMPVAGGSFLDPASSFAKLPLTTAEKPTRARYIGFRFVVER